jgi:glyoxylase-like metal-dependent hydrolase (beta-lactamase superfamily II)
MGLHLEDKAEDVIGKAQSGLGLSDEQLSEKSGLTKESLDALKSGDTDEAALRAVAPALHLNANALVDLALGRYQPEEVRLDGLLAFNTPYPVPGYEEMTVNAYLVYDPKSRNAVVFDTGADATPILEALKEHGLTLQLILLTHAHADHIAALEHLQKKTGNPATYISCHEPTAGAKAIEEGASFTLASLGILALNTPGHSPGGMTYVVQGLERTVAIVGDSLFAGSMGGAAGAWQRALRNNREKILTLPPETILCPGHGPMTTVTEERVHNPFLAPAKR